MDRYISTGLWIRGSLVSEEYSHSFIMHDERLAKGRGMIGCEIFGIAGHCGKKCPCYLKKEDGCNYEENEETE